MRGARVAAATLAVAVAAGIASAEPPGHEDLAPPGPSVDQRLAEIARRVQAVAEYPPIARLRGATGEAHVAFVIDAQGQPREVALTRSSGHGALDRAAERAVAAAAPLPFVTGRITVPVVFALR